MPTNEKAKAVKARLRQEGLTLAQIAEELSVPYPIVCGVLSGHLKGRRGVARRVAVELGLVAEGPDIAAVLKDIREAAEK